MVQVTKSQVSLEGLDHRIFGNRFRRCYIDARPSAGLSGGGTVLEFS
jgi:hypothetical protein